MRQFPGPENFRECEEANLAEHPHITFSLCAGTLGIERCGMPPLASVVNLTMDYGGVSGLSGSAGIRLSAGLVS